MSLQFILNTTDEQEVIVDLHTALDLVRNTLGVCGPIDVAWRELLDGWRLQVIGGELRRFITKPQDIF